MPFSAQESVEPVDPSALLVGVARKAIWATERTKKPTGGCGHSAANSSDLSRHRLDFNVPLAVVLQFRLPQGPASASPLR